METGVEHAVRSAGGARGGAGGRGVCPRLPKQRRATVHRLFRAGQEANHQEEQEAGAHIALEYLFITGRS